MFKIRRQRIMDYVHDIDIVHNLSKKKYEDYKLEKLQELISSSVINVPYYRNLYELGGYSFSQSSELSFYRDLPVLTKKLLRSQIQSFISDDQDLKYASTMTSGSTGASTRFLVAATAAERWYASKIWHRGCFGVSLGDPCLWIWGRLPPTTGVVNKFRNSTSNFIRNEYRLSAFSINEELIYNFLSIVQDRKIKIIYSYTSALYQIVKMMREHNYKIKSKLKLIVCTAELLDEDTRKYLEKFFGCPVVSEYGGAEFGIVATENINKKYIVHRQSLDLFLNKELKEDYSNIIVTDYHNYKMPLIKYDTGDLAFIGSNSKNDTLTAPFDRIAGRVYSSFRLEDGTVVHGEVINYAIKSLFLNTSLTSSEHRFHQYDEKNFKLTLQRKYCLSHSRKQIIGLVSDKLSELSPSFKSANIVLELLDEIPTTTSGKRIYITSDLEL